MNEVKLAAAQGSAAYAPGALLRVIGLSGRVPLHVQGGRSPRVGDVVRVGDYDAVREAAHLPEPFYWCVEVGGNYGAKFTHSDLQPSLRVAVPFLSPDLPRSGLFAPVIFDTARPVSWASINRAAHWALAPSSSPSASRHLR